MPVIKKSSYKAPIPFKNGHLCTIYPALFRKPELAQKYRRERIDTHDGDFLDLDWMDHKKDRAVIISHGLEGHTDRQYVIGMANQFYQEGFDVVAWSYRGCSGEINRKLEMYHSGATYDLESVVAHVERQGFKSICLVGFSLGGNLTLKYLGEYHRNSIKAAVTFSVPLDLYASSLEIQKNQNWVYTRRFLRSLKSKIAQKQEQYPSQVSLKPFDHIKSLIDFDDAYTAPIHGFENALDYYHKCSSMHFLKDIKVATLVVNACNDPFLSPECLDHSLFEPLAQVYFETPRHGGHVGFVTKNEQETYWSEKRALAFCKTITDWS